LTRTASTAAGRSGWKNPEIPVKVGATVAAAATTRAFAEPRHAGTTATNATM
jgi:hypothetical protein